VTVLHDEQRWVCIYGHEFYDDGVRVLGLRRFFGWVNEGMHGFMRGCDEE